MEERLLQLEVEADILRMHIASREAKDKERKFCAPCDQMDFPCDKEQDRHDDILCEDCCRHHEQGQ